MLFTKENPIGLDWYIQTLQTLIYNSLLEAWEITDEKFFECYGRCYRNKKDNGYVAEIYKGKGEYLDAYWNDALSALSFFGMSNNIQTKVLNVADIHLVFFVNLAKIKPAVLHRGDEEARLDLFNLVGAGRFSFNLESIELWIDNVLREYPGTRRDTRLSMVDMHPYHSFRFNFSIIYDPNKNC